MSASYKHRPNRLGSSFQSQPEGGRHLESQTHQDWRLIVRDDGSTDKTPDIIEAFRAHHQEKPPQRLLSVLFLDRLFESDFFHAGFKRNEDCLKLLDGHRTQVRFKGWCVHSHPVGFFVASYFVLTRHL